MSHLPYRSKEHGIWLWTSGYLSSMRKSLLTRNCNHVWHDLFNFFRHAVSAGKILMPAPFAELLFKLGSGFTDCKFNKLLICKFSLPEILGCDGSFWTSRIWCIQSLPSLRQAAFSSDVCLIYTNSCDSSFVLDLYIDYSFFGLLMEKYLGR